MDRQHTPTTCIAIAALAVLLLAVAPAAVHGRQLRQLMQAGSSNLIEATVTIVPAGSADDGSPADNSPASVTSGTTTEITTTTDDVAAPAAEAAPVGTPASAAIVTAAPAAESEELLTPSSAISSPRPARSTPASALTVSAASAAEEPTSEADGATLDDLLSEAGGTGGSPSAAAAPEEEEPEEKLLPLGPSLSLLQSQLLVDKQAGVPGGSLTAATTVAVPAAEEP